MCWLCVCSTRKFHGCTGSGAPMLPTPVYGIYSTGMDTYIWHSPSCRHQCCWGGSMRRKLHCPGSKWLPGVPAWTRFRQEQTLSPPWHSKEKTYLTQELLLRSGIVWHAHANGSSTPLVYLQEAERLYLYRNPLLEASSLLLLEHSQQAKEAPTLPTLT